MLEGTGLEAAMMQPGSGEGAEPPLRDWRVVSGKEWQLVAPGTERDSLPEAEDAGARGDCPQGMVEVVGEMKQGSTPGAIEDLQTRTCTKWTENGDEQGHARSCDAFDRERWASLSRDLPTRTMHFCIDALEYPNQRGEYPVVMVDWREAEAHCADAGARLCTEDEWSFACEGEEARPFATGYVRDAQACVVDRPWRPVRFDVLATRTGPHVLRELDTLWQGEPAGSHPRCRSPFGAYDMVGNVDEWTMSSRATGYRSILKGGYWGTIRARCRSSTRAHNEDFYFYQIGFRCCAPAAPGRPGGALSPPPTSTIESP